MAPRWIWILFGLLAVSGYSCAPSPEEQRVARFDAITKAADKHAKAFEFDEAIEIVEAFDREIQAEGIQLTVLNQRVDDKIAQLCDAKREHERFRKKKVEEQRAARFDAITKAADKHARAFKFDKAIKTVEAFGRTIQEAGIRHTVFKIGRAHV